MFFFSSLYVEVIKLSVFNFSNYCSLKIKIKILNEKYLLNSFISALIFHFSDPSPAVRRGIVSLIALNKLTIGHVLARTRDINDNVRRNAFLVFSRIKPLNMTIKYRVTILDRGLNDRSGNFRDF